jgi:arylsulfatase A-like enzyme
MDGIDLVPLVRGDAPTPPIFWRSGTYRSILANDWKLQVQDHPPKMWLFDMAADPTEQRNLAVARPDKVAELSAILAEHERQMMAPSWPSLIEAPIPVDHPLGMPAAPDWEYVTWAN